MTQKNSDSKLISNKVLIIAAIFCCLSCSKSDNLSDPNYAIVPELRGIFNWKMGSYWIMKDSLSGQVDSFAVTLYESYDPPYNYNHHDHLGVRINEYPLSKTADTVEMGFGLDPQSDNIFVFRNARKNIYLSSLQVLTPPYKPNRSNYIQDGTAFGDVYSISLPMYESGRNTSSAEVNLVFSKESGLIRIADNVPGHSHVWHTMRSLIR